VIGIFRAAAISYYAKWNNHAPPKTCLIADELQKADVSATAFSFAADFKNVTTFTPRQAAEHALDQLISWATALRSIRTSRLACAFPGLLS
jgi:hypothetical protein